MDRPHISKPKCTNTHVLCACPYTKQPTHEQHTNTTVYFFINADWRDLYQHWRGESYFSCNFHELIPLQSTSKALSPKHVIFPNFLWHLAVTVHVTEVHLLTRLQEVGTCEAQAITLSAAKGHCAIKPQTYYIQILTVLYTLCVCVCVCVCVCLCVFHIHNTLSTLYASLSTALLSGDKQTTQLDLWDKGSRTIWEADKPVVQCSYNITPLAACWHSLCRHSHDNVLRFILYAGFLQLLNVALTELHIGLE